MIRSHGDPESQEAEVARVLDKTNLSEVGDQYCIDIDDWYPVDICAQYPIACARTVILFLLFFFGSNRNIGFLVRTLKSRDC